MTNYTQEQIEILRNKRQTPEGRRAHWLCVCGFPISADKETCPQCNAHPDTFTGFGIANLPYKREATKKRFQIK